MHDETRVNHPPKPFPPLGNEPLTFPIYQSVKFSWPSLADLEKSAHGGPDSYFYSRASNPSVRMLEKLLAELQGRPDAVAVGSGVATIAATLISLLKQGDHALLFVETYKPTRYLLRTLLAKYGVTSTMLSIADLGSIERAVIPGKTRLMIFESPTNPMTRVADLERLTQIARKHGVITVLDNTFAGFHQHGDLPIDLYLHSLTKFAGGHGDVMGGAIIGDPKLLDLIRMDVMQLGPTLDPHAAYLIARGMKTYFLRYRRQAENAAKIAAWLADPAQSGWVESVRFPGLKSHPDHALALKQMKDFGTIVSFDLSPKLKGGLRKFVDSLKLFRLAGSVGSTESLVAPVHAFFGGDLTSEECKTAWITDRSIRLSIGIEEIGDLLADLESALAAAS